MSVAANCEIDARNQGLLPGATSIERELAVQISAMHIWAESKKFSSEYSLELLEKVLTETDQVNVVSKIHGKAPIHIASVFQTTDVLKALIDHGANVNLRDMEDFTAVYHAVAGDSVPALKLLLNRGAFLIEKHTSDFTQHINLRGTIGSDNVRCFSFLVDYLEYDAKTLTELLPKCVAAGAIEIEHYLKDRLAAV